MRRATASRETSIFLAWALVGALAMLGVLSILTVGLFVLPLAAVLGAATVRAVGLTSGAVGFLAGLGVPLAYVGWLNRQGPGEVCRAVRDGTSCTEAWSPWPWWCAAVFCLVVATVLFRSLRRRTAR